MNDQPMTKPVFDRTVEDLGNVVELGHVNVTVPDQRLATLFYVSGLGLTRDPYLMTGIENMWVNVGRGAVPSALAARRRWCAAPPALVLPDLEALLRRLHGVQEVSGRIRKFSFRETTTRWRRPAPGATASASCARPGAVRPDARGHALCRIRRPAGTD